MNKILQWFTSPPVDGPAAIVWIRLMTGGMFLWEGILKFVYVNQGVGRFTKLEIPFPEISANLIGLLEIFGGAFIIGGFATRAICGLFIIEMIVAVLSTKVALYLGTSPLPLPPSAPQVGIWAVLHEIRAEYAQLLTLVFLCLAGPGIFSLDARSRKRRRTGKLSMPEYSKK